MIEHYDKVFHTQELGSYAQGQGSLAVLRSQPGIKVIIRDLRGHLLHSVTFLVLIFFLFCHYYYSANQQHCLYSDFPTLLPLMMPRPPVPSALWVFFFFLRNKKKIIFELSSSAFSAFFFFFLRNKKKLSLNYPH